MPTLAAALKSEIRRLASKEVEKALRPLRRVQKQLKKLRLVSRGHRRVLAKVQRRIARFKTRRDGAPRIPGRRGRRASPQGIRGLRGRLGMTRLQFAKLLGVSPGSIFGWETGRTVPRGKSQARLAEVRKMGARAARASVQGAAGPRGRRGPGRRRARA